MLRRQSIPIFLFVISIVSGLFWNHRFFFHPIRGGGDEVNYDGIARDIVAHHRYTDRGEETYIEPLYPLFVAGIYLVSNNNQDAVRFIQLFLFGCISVLVYRIGQRMFSERVGQLAGFLVASIWIFANQTGMILREILFTFLLVYLIYEVVLFLEAQKYWRIFVIGLLLGFLILTNAVLQYFLFILTIFFAVTLTRKIGWRRMTENVVLFLVGCFLILTPWTIRSLWHDGSDAQISARSGRLIAQRAYLMEQVASELPKFFVGHLLGYYFAEQWFPDINFRTYKDTEPIDTFVVTEHASGKRYAEIDAILKTSGLVTIREKPLLYLTFSVLSFIDLNSPIIPQRIFEGNEAIHVTFADGRWETVPTVVKVVVLLCVRFVWYGFLFFVVYGIIMLFRTHPQKAIIGFFVLIIFYFNAIYSAIHVVPRYLIPVLPLYILLATAGVASSIEKRQAIRHTRPEIIKV